MRRASEQKKPLRRFEDGKVGMVRRGKAARKKAKCSTIREMRRKERKDAHAPFNGQPRAAVAVAVDCRCSLVKAGLRRNRNERLQEQEETSRRRRNDHGSHNAPEARNVWSWNGRGERR